MFTKKLLSKMVGNVVDNPLFKLYYNSNDVF